MDVREEKMAVTQEVVMNFLLDQGGKVKNSELLKKFKPLVESPDPQEKAKNRELFKTFVNNIAVVKDEEGGKCVVLRKKHWHLLAERQTKEQEQETAQEKETPKEEGAPILPAIDVVEAVLRDHKRRSSQQDLPEGKEDLQIESNQQNMAEGECLGENVHSAIDPPSESIILKEYIYLLMTLVKARESVFAIVARMDNPGPAPIPKGPPKEPAQKPFMLPLRYPQPSSALFDDTEDSQDENTYMERRISNAATVEITKPIQPRSPHVSRRQFEDAGSKSPHTKRSSKMLKVSDECKYSDVVPLDSTEHEWLVKATSGHWNLKLYGLLLTDTDLVDKRDFISGFTALHWAAKSGNTDMVKTLIDISRKAGIHPNVNVKSFGGYTPLHIAAIHDHKDVILMLVMEYNAKVNIRDHSGKKPYQYLKKGSSVKIRTLLSDPQAHAEKSIPAKRNSKVASSILGTTSAFLGVISDDLVLTDIAKGLKKPGSLNKFFAGPTGQKKKLKVRDSYPSITSLSEEMEEEPEEPVGKRRPMSEFLYH
ncbi:LOW QUALITY PROTEIN: ankyrin repeat domain-containing protein SOWAHA [Discoglossus pictus]